MQQKIAELEKLIGEEYSNIGGIVVLKNGKKVYENYFNGYNSETAFHVFSETKSIFSVLLGIAADKGYIKSIDEKVLDFFPDYIPKRGEKTIQQVKIRDMITMTAPYKYKSAPYTKYFTSENWVEAALDLLGGKGKIGEFRYTPMIGPDILSGILTAATGKSALEFAVENLFEPLGIGVFEKIVFSGKEQWLDLIKNRHKSGWVSDPKGISTTGWGLFITAADMAKIGELYFEHGSFLGKQLVSEKWVLESTTEHSRLGELPYGYLWWVISEEERCYAAIGDGGNILYINEKKGLVVSVASTFNPRAKDRLILIKEHIEPLFFGKLKG